MSLSRMEQLLQDNLELAEENNRLLRQLRRAVRASFWARIILWAIVIALPLLLLRPVLNAVVPATGDGAGPFGLFPSLEDAEKFREILDSGSLAQ